MCAGPSVRLMDALGNLIRLLPCAGLILSLQGTSGYIGISSARACLEDTTVVVAAYKFWLKFRRLDQTYSVCFNVYFRYCYVFVVGYFLLASRCISQGKQREPRNLVCVEWRN